MPEPEHLTNAPITEALIDFRVKLPPDANLDRLSPFCREISDEYPTCRERRKWHSELTFSKTALQNIKAGSTEPDGYLLTSADGIQVVQARLDGFTFSRLKPYETWTQLRDATRLLWERYCQVAAPTLVTRIAVRYINRLELPRPCDNFREWILTVPEVAPDLPQGLAGFLMQLKIPFEKQKTFVNVTQVLEPGDHKEHVPLIFDIDAFIPEDFEPTSEGIWSRLDDLRDVKNEVFFKSITEKAKELFR